MSLEPEQRKLPARAAIARALALCCVTAFAYLPALRSGFAWDDDMLVTGNSLITAASGLHKLWFSTASADYWPVTLTAFWVQWRLWGSHALGYHAVNVSLHIAEALLLWAVLRRLGLRAAYLAALLYAVHPVNVESVAWISELKNLMAMLFFLLSIWFFLGFEAIKGGATRPSGPGLGRSQTWRRRDASPRLSYILSLASFILAMLSKGSVAILPLVLLGIIRWRRPIGRRDLLAVAPFFVVSAIGVGVDVWFQRHGAPEVFRSAGFLERLLGAGAVVWFYLGHALWPVNLMFVYPPWHIRPADPLWWVPLLAAVGFALGLWRIGRPWSRAVLFAWGFFCVSLAPVMGFTDVYFMKYSLVADRYGQIALIGVVTLVAARCDPQFKTKYKDRGLLYFLLPAFSLLIVCALGSLTYFHSNDFRDARTLFAATIRRNPQAWLAYNYLGSTPPSVGRPEGIAYIEKALESKPDYAEAHYNLGVAFAGEGRLTEAIAHYREALRLKPDFAEAHNNLGTALRDSGQTSEAVREFQEALRLNPGYAQAHFNLGVLLAGRGRTRDAIDEYREVLRIDPYNAEAHNNLGGLLLGLPGLLSEAISHYESAAQLDPDSAVIQANLGFALANAGRLPEAVAHDEEALRLDPSFAAVHANLGYALMQMGRVDAARAQFQEAERLRSKP